MALDLDLVFRLAMQPSALGMALLAPDGRVLRANEALGRMLGRSVDELGACTGEQLTHPEDLAAEEAHRQELLAGRADAYRLAKRFLRPDGSAVWAQLSAHCVRDERGAVQVFVCQVAELDRRESEGRFQLVLDALQELVVLLRPLRDRQGLLVDFAIEEANRAWIRAHAPEVPEVRGRRLLEVLPMAAQHLPLHESVLATGESQRLDLITPAGLWMEIEFTRVGDRLLAVARDVTARKGA